MTLVAISAARLQRHPCTTRILLRPIQIQNHYIPQVAQILLNENPKENNVREPKLM